MKYLIGFLTGTVFGAAIALLYAPMSGEELRGELRREADARYQQAQQQLQKGLTEVNNRIDKLSAELKTLIEEARRSLPTPGKESPTSEGE
jgi:gas vesicle protein